MGLYCSVTVPVQCPYCGIVEARECQTKDLRGIYDFEAWKVGDNILASFPDELHCRAGCTQLPTCGRPETFPNGNTWVHERRFRVTVKLKNSLITGEHESFEDHEG